MSKPATGQPAPALDIATVRHGDWSLGHHSPERFSLVVFYRGHHCPLCKSSLTALEQQMPAFRERGTEPIAVSMDARDRAQQSVEDWGLEALPVGYGLSESSARDWGLYLSSRLNDKETEQFAEPGVFLVRPDGTLYGAIIQSMPFARPHWEDLLKAVDFVTEHDYPPRGQAA